MREGWRTQRLGDLCEIVKGRKPQLKAEASEGDLPYLVAKVMRGNQEPEFAALSDRNSVFVSEEDTIIICDGSNSGEVFTGFRGILSSTMGKLLKKGDIDDAYLRAFLDSTFEVFNGAKTGAAIPHLDKEALYALPFSYPALSEQRRIVAILDDAFEGIATAKANAEKNLQNARELFERYLEVLFSPPQEGWVASTLGSTYDVRDGTHDSPKYYDQGYPLVTSKNLKRDGLSFDDVKLIADADYRKINERSAVHKGDVLFAMIGTIGNPTVVEVEPSFAIKNVALFKVPTGQSGHYLRYYLSSQGVVTKMLSEAKGTTQRFVGLGYLRAFPVPVPPLSEQLALVRELDELSMVVCRLERIFAEKIAALDELKKSLLRQAFSGQL